MPHESRIADAFRSLTGVADSDLFEELLASVRFEELGKGRQGAVLTKVDVSIGVPIVRTTTRYSAPAQCFRSLHERLAERIQARASLAIGFNHALIETYTNAYATMGAHSDQALDLADASFVAVYSCYRYPAPADPPRKLIVEGKTPGGEVAAIPLEHDGVVLFSIDANRRFKHKIVLDAPARTPENPWLGVTFRTSKTFLRFRDARACFPDGTSLTLADEEQRQAFYALRGRENRETDFIYPSIPYAISESNLLPPEAG